MHASQLLVGDGKAFYKYNGVCTEKLAFVFFFLNLCVKSLYKFNLSKPLLKEFRK